MPKLCMTLPLAIFMMAFCTLTILCPQEVYGVGMPPSPAFYDKMAIYFGDWHVDPDMARQHGPGWTEWELVTNAQPRYEGHLQPNVPQNAPGFGLNASENDPAVMEKKLAAAAAHGITAMLFDWCAPSDSNSSVLCSAPYTVVL